MRAGMEARDVPLKRRGIASGQPIGVRSHAGAGSAQDGGVENVQLTPRTDWDVVWWRITEIRYAASGVTLALTRTSLQAEQGTEQAHAHRSVA